MTYAVVYDPYFNIAGPLFTGVSFALIMVFVAWNPQLYLRPPRPIPFFVRVLVVVGPVVILICFGGSIIADLVVQRHRLATGDYTVTDGVVRDFSPVGNHTPARFTLDGVPFTGSGGFRFPIYNGDRLRILHRGDLILRVEKPRPE